MINLENTKVILFDFDDTLCIHEEHQSNEEQKRIYNKNVLKEGIQAWSGKPNIHMKKFMKECEKKNIQMGLISATVSVKHAKGKHDWVLMNYGINLENFCVGTFENKLAIMFAIADAYNIPKSQIMIVDDYWENLERAANAGFTVCSPMEVVNFVEEEHYKEPNEKK